MPKLTSTANASRGPKTAKLFKNGSSQAVRLPKEFRFEGDQVWIEQRGDHVILTPYHDRLSLLKESLALFTDEVYLERQQPQGTDQRPLLES
jgi:antitoxin VapB